MPTKRKPDWDYDGRGNIRRATKDALKAVFDPGDHNSVDCEELARIIADATYDAAEQLAFNMVWKHEHKQHGVE